MHSLLASSPGGFVAAVRAAGLRGGVERAGYRLEWLRFARLVDVVPRDHLVRLGSAYGGYVVPEDLLQSDWICYCAGLGEDISFELELTERFGCAVYGFDPTSRSAAHAEVVAAGHERFEYLPYGLWSSDVDQRFYAPKDPTHVSHSIANLQSTEEYFTAECRSIPSVMAELGHDRVDLLKLDIEGAEYEVLDSMLETGVEVKVLLVDIHRVRRLADMGRVVERLREHGYMPVHVHRTDVTFVNSRLV